MQSRTSPILGFQLRVASAWLDCTKSVMRQSDVLSGATRPLSEQSRSNNDVLVGLLHRCAPPADPSDLQRVANAKLSAQVRQPEDHAALAALSACDRNKRAMSGARNGRLNR